MGCCNNTTTTSACNDKDAYSVCLSRQIEQLATRTDQLKAQIEILNTGEPFDGLCEIQTCDSPNCSNTGIMACNTSPTGRPVGSDADSCCGQANPSNLGDYVDSLANKIRLLDERLTKSEIFITEIRKTAVKRVLLNISGDVKGWETLNGQIKNANKGTWEMATT